MQANNQGGNPFGVQAFNQVNNQVNGQANMQPNNPMAMQGVVQTGNQPFNPHGMQAFNQVNNQANIQLNNPLPMQGVVPTNNQLGAPGNAHANLQMQIQAHQQANPWVYQPPVQRRARGSAEAFKDNNITDIIRMNFVATGTSSQPGTLIVPFMRFPEKILEATDTEVELNRALALITDSVIQDLPVEVILLILSEMDIFTRAAFALTCKPFAVAASLGRMLEYDFVSAVEAPLVYEGIMSKSASNFKTAKTEFFRAISNEWEGRHPRGFRYCDCCGLFRHSIAYDWERWVFSQFRAALSGTLNDRLVDAVRGGAMVKYIDEWCGATRRASGRCPECRGKMWRR